MRKTKIIATIGPASDSKEIIENLILAGVNVFRFNMKHGTVAWHEERIVRVQEVAASLEKSIGILIDLQGPEIRIETKDGKEFEVKKGDKITFSNEFLSVDNNVYIPQKIVFSVLEVGDSILIDDGFIECKVIEKKENILVAEALDDCVIKTRKGLNLPGKKIDLPSLIEDDLKKLDMAVKSKVDFVALSFSRTAKDIEVLRNELKQRKVIAEIIAKIESQEALDNIDDLVSEADGIMVARGDLGIEVPIEELAYWQETIIRKCRQAKKPVIVATQMLQSMIDNPRPTRAEATDIANAVFDGTDAIMLSGETASGKYPIKAVEAMSRIAAFNENRAVDILKIEAFGNTELIVKSAMNVIENKESKIDALVVFTQTGYTARICSSYRPHIPIIAITDQHKTIEYLTISYGLKTHLAEFPEGEFRIPERIINELKDKKLIKAGQTLAVIHGAHWQKPGLTNSLVLITVN